MVTDAALTQLRLCAFCPNICRAAWPSDLGTFPESQAPSALAYLAIAVIDGFVERSPDVDRALGATDVAERCSPACPYGVDLPASLRAVVGRSV